MAITRSTPWRELGDVPYATWRNAILDAGGPEPLASRAAYEAAQPHSAVLLNKLRAESSFGTSVKRNNPAVTRNPFSLRVYNEDGTIDSANEGNVSGYLHFASWPDGVKAARQRITDPGAFAAQTYGAKNPYPTTKSLSDLIYAFSPPGPGGTWNNTEKIVEESIAYLNRIVETEEPMTITIEQEIIPESNANRPGSKLNADPAKWITIHETANYSIGAGARMHSRFVRNGGGNEGVSFHMTVDDQLAIQMMPLDEVAYHAGDGCDNRTTDLGCFQSVAIETCVNADSVWEVTKENLVQLCAAIIKGDKRLAFGLSKGHFSPNRLAQHNKWSGKNCPARMRGEGSWGNVTGRILTAAGEPTPTPPPDPLPELFPGIDIEVARRLFGSPIGEDGRKYPFDPNGPVSKAWLEDSEASGEWPALEEVWSYGDGRRYYVFEGGRAYLFSDGELRRLKA